MAPKDPELEALKAEINEMIDKFKVVSLTSYKQ